MKAAEISPTKRKANRTSTATAWRMLGAAATVRMAIVRTAETVAGAADVLAAGGGTVDAVDGLVVVDAIGDAAGLVGGDTRASLTRIYTDQRG